MKWENPISYEVATEQAKEHVASVCDPVSSLEPQLDPNLFGTKDHESLHKDLLKYANAIGHRGDSIEG